MPKGKKLIYSGYMDGILDHGIVHRFGIEEVFSDKYDDRAMDTSIYDLYILDLSNLESEKSAEHRKKQTGQGLKIPVPNQMLHRLPVVLA